VTLRSIHPSIWRRVQVWEDATKVWANASKQKAMSYGRMKEEEQRQKTEIKELLRHAQEIDEAEDEKYGAAQRGDGLPEELRRREDRLKKIQEAKQRPEEQQKEEVRPAGRDENDGRWAWGVRPQGGRSRHHREFGKVPAKKQENFTDPESWIMKTQDGFQLSLFGPLSRASYASPALDTTNFPPELSPSEVATFCRLVLAVSRVSLAAA